MRNRTKKREGADAGKQLKKWRNIKKKNHKKRYWSPLPYTSEHVPCSRPKYDLEIEEIKEEKEDDDLMSVCMGGGGGGGGGETSCHHLHVFAIVIEASTSTQNFTNPSGNCFVPQCYF